MGRRVGSESWGQDLNWVFGMENARLTLNIGLKQRKQGFGFVFCEGSPPHKRQLPKVTRKFCNSGATKN